MPREGYNTHTIMHFDELPLTDNILDALWDMRFDQCTPIQEACIPLILQRRDLLGIAQTGTGKTAAYLLPILSLLDSGDYPEETINAVIMSPTRELAQQIDRAMQGFGYYLPRVSSLAIYGGNDGARFEQEHKALRTGADIIIATPGRLISHKNIGNLNLSQCHFFVLDEADCMLDMGFHDDIMLLAKELPATCQVLMFSATMPTKIETLAKALLKDPAMVKLAVSKPVEAIQQSAYVCYEPQKIKIISHLFQEHLTRVLLFCGKKNKVKEVCRTLRLQHVNAGEMHSDLTQQQRDEMMFRFKSGQIDVLVATDILARGIDIDDIALVINYDVPHDVEDYIHRIGRTARAEKQGQAITLVNPDDIKYFAQIERFLGYTIAKSPVPEDLGEAPQYILPAKQHKQHSHGRNKPSVKQPQQKALAASVPTRTNKPRSRKTQHKQ